MITNIDRRYASQRTAAVNLPMYSFVNRPWKFTLVVVLGTIIILSILSLLMYGEINAHPFDYAIPLSAILAYSMGVVVTRYWRLLEEKNRQLEQINLQLDNFARMVAHDLKSPLHLIAGYAAMIGEDCEQPDPVVLREYVQMIEGSVEKAAEIIDELLLLASLEREAIALEPLNMGEIVQRAWKRHTMLIKRHAPELVLPAEWLPARGRAPWVEAVWSNYLSNAIKYGGSPARIEVFAEPLTNGDVKYCVRDNGQGIALDEQPRLFQEFSPLPRRLDGSGLGLSICHRIIERLGGQVGVESQPGQGSTFYFTLPGLDKTVS